MHPRNHGSTCPTSGVASARYTRGSIDEGPGVNINRFGGFNSPICDVMLISYSLRDPNSPAPWRSPATDILALISRRVYHLAAWIGLAPSHSALLYPIGCDI